MFVGSTTGVMAPEVLSLILQSDSLPAWIQLSNFSIDANVKEAEHRSNEELKTELVNLENECPGGGDQ